MKKMLKKIHHYFTRPLGREHFLAAFALVLLTGAALYHYAYLPYPAEALENTPVAATWTTNGTVKSIVSSATTTYLGGEFTAVGMTASNGVLVDTATGLPASGLPAFDGNVAAVVPDGTGGWYVGGSFTAVGTESYFYLVHLLADKTLDLEWNPNPDGYITSLRLVGPTLYVAGTFTQISETPRAGLAALEASSGALLPWNPLVAGGSGVNTLTSTDSKLIIGGSFSGVGGTGVSTTGARVSNTDGVGILPTPPVDGSIYASENDGAGGWFIGGEFLTVGGRSRQRIAHILADGSVDPDWNPGASNRVQTLHRIGTTLYVGGYFQQIAGVSRHGIAALDTVTGEALPWDPNILENGVRSIATTDTKFIAAGDFNTAGHPVDGAALDATTAAMPADPPRFNGAVQSSVSDGAGGWYVGGYFTRVGTTDRNHAAHILSDNTVDPNWDPNVGGTEVDALERVGNTVYIGGQFTTVSGSPRWNLAAVNADDGQLQSWDPSPNSVVYRLKTDGTTLFAAGNFTFIGGNSRFILASFDVATGNLTSWNPHPNSSVYAIEFGAGDTVYIGGSYTQIASTVRSGLSAFDKSTGALLPFNPGVGGGINAMAYIGGTLYIGGGVFTTVNGVPRDRLAALDGTTGAVDLSWNPGAATNFSVQAMGLIGTTLYVGGPFTTIAGVARGSGAAFDTTTGNILPWNPQSTGYAYTIATDDTRVFIGGALNAFAGVGALPRGGLAVFDLATGDLTSVNMNSSWSQAVAVHGTTAYMGGQFSSVGGQTRRGLAAFDVETGALSDWNPSTTPGNSVQSLAVSDDGTMVYAGGAFSAMGGQTRHFLAELDASTGLATGWNPDPDAAFAGFIEMDSLVVDGGDIYVGGYFDTIGGQTRHRAAKIDRTTGLATAWDPSPTPDPYQWVYSIAPSGAAVFVGGNTNIAAFNGTGPAPRQNIAAFDLTTGELSPWNPGLDGQVIALTASPDGHTVYAGGAFSNYVAALDIEDGSPTFGQPVPSFEAWTDGYVDALAVSHDGVTLYLGGQFNQVDNQARVGLASIDAASGNYTDWQPAPNNQINALALSPDGTTLYIGGMNVGSDYGERVAAFNTATGDRVTMTADTDGSVHALSLNEDGSLLFAGGEFTMTSVKQRSNLAALSNATGAAIDFAPALNAPVYALDLSPDGTVLYAGGDFTNYTEGEALPGCDQDPTRTILTGGPGSGGCHLYDDDQVNCEKAWINGGGGVASCFNDAMDATGFGVNSCNGCGDINENNGYCVNTCKQPSWSYLTSFSTATGAVRPWRPDPDSTVHSIKSGVANVYVGGEFSQIGAQSRYNIAELNTSDGLATDWDPRTNGTVNTLALNSGGTAVYAGGIFNSAGRATSSALIDKTTGTSLRPFPHTDGTIDALESDGAGGWYVGGDFSMIEKIPRQNLAHVLAGGAVDLAWEGQADVTVRKIQKIGSLVYVAGCFATVGGEIEHYGIAALDAGTGHATNWFVPVVGGCFNDFAVSDGVVYAGGDFGAAAFDQTTGALTPWTANIAGGSAVVNAVAVQGNTIYLGGDFTDAVTVPRTNAAALDTSGNLLDWYPQDLDQPVNDIIATDSRVYLGGPFSSVLTEGSVIPSYRPGVAAVDPVTGYLMTDWEPGFGSHQLKQMVLDGNTLYFNGENLGALDTVTGDQIYTWTPVANNTTFAMGVDATDIAVGGQFTGVVNAGEQQRPQIAAFDTATDNVLPFNPSGSATSISALAFSGDGNTLFAGGSSLGYAYVDKPDLFPWFDTAYAAPCKGCGGGSNGIFAFNSSSGTASPVAMTSEGDVYALLIHGDTLYAGGFFTAFNSQPRAHLASVNIPDGVVSDWQPAPDGSVLALAMNPTGSLISIGGQFNVIAGMNLPSFAQFSSDALPSAPETGRSHPLSESHPDLSSGGAPSGDVQNGPFNLNISFRVKVKNVRDKLVLDRIKAVTHQQYDSLDAILSDANVKEKVLSTPDINSSIKGHRETFVLSVWPRGSRRGALFTQTVTTNLLGEASLTLSSFPPGFYDFTLDTPQALRTALNNVDARYQGVSLDFTRGNNEELHYGDFNGDGKIDLSDISAAITALQSPDSARRQTVDLNEDGTVDLSDFAKLIQNWGKGQ